MEDKRRAIIDKQVLIPISFVITLLTGCWFLSALNSKVCMNRENITEIAKIVETSPSRIEFSRLQVVVDEISSDVKKLLGKN